jgi:hypothetical protein
MNSQHAIGASVLAFAILLAACESRDAPKSVQKPGDERVTVRGRLTRVAAIGAETTGWAIQLDAPLTVEGNDLRRIEIYGNEKRWSQLAERSVEATGKISFREGIERGRYPVLEVQTIQEAQPR